MIVELNELAQVMYNLVYNDPRVVNCFRTHSGNYVLILLNLPSYRTSVRNGRLRVEICNTAKIDCSSSEAMLIHKHYRLFY